VSEWLYDQAGHCARNLPLRAVRLGPLTPFRCSHGWSHFSCSAAASIISLVLCPRLGMRVQWDSSECLKPGQVAFTRKPEQVALTPPLEPAGGMKTLLSKSVGPPPCFSSQLFSFTAVSLHGCLAPPKASENQQCLRLPRALHYALHLWRPQLHLANATPADWLLDRACGVVHGGRHGRAAISKCCHWAPCWRSFRCMPATRCNA